MPVRAQLHHVARFDFIREEREKRREGISREKVEEFRCRRIMMIAVDLTPD